MQDAEYLKVGSYTPPDENGDGEKIVREFYGQGMIFKDEYAFYHEVKVPCYVPELSDTVYTREDFLRICNDQDDIAEAVFGAVDWQHPETYLDEQWMGDEPELAECSCGKWFWCYGVKKCPYCGKEREENGVSQ